MQSLRTKVNGSSAVAGRRGVAVPARATVRHAAASEQLNAAASSTSSSGASVAVSGVKAAALAAAAASLVIASPAYAAEVVNTVAMDGGSATAAVGGLGAIAGLGALLIATDPQKRRDAQMASTDGNESEAVKNYFDTTGFERWRKIYGETDDVNKVQLDIRNGHAVTVEKTLKWLAEDGSVAGKTVADCGCGTGSLAIPLALRGATLHATDISSSMVGEAARRYEQAVSGQAPPAVAPRFEAMGLEDVKGKYDVVTCLDVMIHYPQDRADSMISHLASLSNDRLIISFAPKTLAYSVLKRIGELFPGPSKATRAYLHAEDDVEACLNRNGFKVVKKEMTATSFYFSRLFEAVRE